MLGLEPSIDQERFEIEAFLGHILENSPGIGAVAPPLLPDFFYRGEEFRGVLSADAISNRHKDRPIFVLNSPRRYRRPPMHGRRQVDPLGRLQFPTPCKRDRQQGARGGGKMS